LVVKILKLEQYNLLTIIRIGSCGLKNCKEEFNVKRKKQYKKKRKKKEKMKENFFEKTETK